MHINNNRSIAIKPRLVAPKTAAAAQLTSGEEIRRPLNSISIFVQLKIFTAIKLLDSRLATAQQTLKVCWLTRQLTVT